MLALLLCFVRYIIVLLYVISGGVGDFVIMFDCLIYLLSFGCLFDW